MVLSRFTAAAVVAVTLASPLSALAATTPSTAFSQKPFTDVPASSPLYEAVEFFRKGNVLKGYPDGTFKPGRRITRAEFTTLMVNPLFLSNDDVNNCISEFTPEDSPIVFFKDVRPTDDFAQQVCLAKVKHIVDGYADGYFRPNNTISFVEAAKIASTVLQLQIRKESHDDPRWYVAYVQELSSQNAIPTTIRRLTKPMTRGEVAEIVYRLKMDRTDKPSLHWADFD